MSQKSTPLSREDLSHVPEEGEIIHANIHLSMGQNPTFLWDKGTFLEHPIVTVECKILNDDL